MNTQATGLILAGGQGRRMGGADKGLVEWNGQPLVAHVLKRLAPQVSAVIISANRNRDRYTAYAPTVVEDDWNDFRGPLAGLLAGLGSFSGKPAGAVICVPCDAPDLPTDLAERLLRTWQPRSTVIADDGDREQPLFCATDPMLAPTILEYLESGRRSVFGWLETTGYAAVDFSDQPLAFRNLNAPGDLSPRAREPNVRNGYSGR